MKFKHFTVLFIFSLILSACSNDVNPKEHVGEIYSIALDSMMELDPGLNSNMEFIAIDMSNFNDLNEDDKDDILLFFKEKYEVDVMDATMEELKEKGLYNPETTALYGVLLEIQSVDFKSNHTIFFEGSKYRSGLGAIGVEGTVHYKDGEWEIKESKVTWIS